MAEKKRLLREYGFEGIDPLDTELAFSDDQAKPDRGHRTYKANSELMDSCDAIIANLTPFRGISADPGTVYEVGNSLWLSSQANIRFSLQSFSTAVFRRLPVPSRYRVRETKSFPVFPVPVFPRKPGPENRRPENRDRKPGQKTGTDLFFQKTGTDLFFYFRAPPTTSA